MSNQELEDEKATLIAENAAILVKSSAVGIAGSIAALYIANRQKVTGWGKFGYFLAGGYIARLPLAFYYADKLSQNLTRINQLQRLLDAQ